MTYPLADSDKQRLLALLATHFGIRTPTLQPLVGGQVNYVYRAGMWVLKVYNLDRVDLVRAQEVIHLQAWLADYGLPIPKPLQTKDGALWAQSDEGLMVVMPFVQGERRTRATLTHKHATNLGTVLAALHQTLTHAP
jgi:Ser/Thr protein kinase RdoA (MazF antagonist)